MLTRHPPSDRLPAALPAQMTAQRELLSVRAETLASWPIVTCAPDDTVTQAARRMRDRYVSSLVVDSRPPGLVTATDLRDRVLAAGPGELAAYARAVAAAAARLVRAGTPPAAVTRFVTSAHDALYVMATNPARRVPLGA